MNDKSKSTREREYHSFGGVRYMLSWLPVDPRKRIKVTVLISDPYILKLHSGEELEAVATVTTSVDTKQAGHRKAAELIINIRDHLITNTKPGREYRK